MLLFFYHDEIRVDFNYVMRPLIKKKKKTCEEARC